MPFSGWVTEQALIYPSPNFDIYFRGVRSRHSLRTNELELNPPSALKVNYRSKLGEGRGTNELESNPLWPSWVREDL